ncbi:chromosome segregation protein SMC [Ornithinimicrobium avium]|uniref:Chromosome partition protein Smc n=1 Tax=Ornithinimicrobium avium TaxID=2283195 RepID=A0A345NIK7_9MICO|nr:chromosome segregation protein SMC [Ornithinimicrobium avium]AXH94865.1 chromosome segregation protein SMC [Ornithinimicrobium avium]
MYVKSLTLKGFKSFASATTMRLEPGITCIVGPNGSGKSNVVDALAWVMGEQGAKSLRGGKMEDVIFAGTSGRPPLGRAEVSMTIDNTDGALPIDYTEVTITRTMFRSGGSEYAINGTGCRLLDVQELLSDSGIGREMHVIVGQGQLDAVLRATPEERRGFIEEAAGVLKHRKRKERALRKLDTMEGNLTRLTDLVTEIRRQLGPLGRQAETARRAATIQAEVRDARLRILADDLVQLTSTLEQEIADEQALVRRRAAVQEGVEAAEAMVLELERERAEASPALTEVQDRWYSLSSSLERLRALRDLSAERVRLLGAEEEELRGQEHGGSGDHRGGDPEQLRARAEQVRAEETALLTRVADLSRALEEAAEERGAAEAAHAEEQSRLQRLARAAADRREGLARLAGQVAAKRSRIEAGEGEIERLRAAAASVDERAGAAEQDFAALESTVLDVEDGEEGLDAEHESAEAARTAAEEQVASLTEELRSAQAEQGTLQARVEALSLSLRRTDGASALLGADTVGGVRGTLADRLRVEPGREAAVAAALGWAGEALVVDGLEPARRALGWLREQDQGRAGLLVPDAAPEVDRSGWPSLPGYAGWAADAVGTDDAGLAHAVTGLLARVALVGSEDDALRLLHEVDGVTVVTEQGDVYGPGWARGGSSAAPSLLELQSALDEARAGIDGASARAERATFALRTAREALEQAEEREDAALEALHDSDARMTAVAEQLAQLGQVMRSARAEHERTSSAITTAEQGLEATRAELAELEQRLTDAESVAAESGETTEPDTDERERLAEAAARARSAETEARLALRTQEERARALAGRADGLEAAARNELAARERAARRRARRAEERRTAEAVGSAAAYLVERVGHLVAQAEQEREVARARQAERDQQLAAARSRAQELAAELRDLTDSVHADEIARAEQRLRIEALQTRAVEELGVDPATLVEEYGPHRLIPHIAGPDDPADEAERPEPAPFVREVQDKRLRAAERRLAQLGRVNPLALEEFAALEERHTFLAEQVEDLRRSKADLLEIVKEVDERVEQVFTQAFHDTAEQFERVFSRLFPGGEGRITLTDPDDMLTTGIEVEARPPGKKIKRLSLLSGGERSLTAVALLVAIFKARPSPFYIMDEVEAALDDTNLGRLITLFEELRDSSQLIVITHQKRTMEVADALYGVSMQGDGVTTVVSQRVKDVTPQGAAGPVTAGSAVPDPEDGAGIAEASDAAAGAEMDRSPEQARA